MLVEMTETIKGSPDGIIVKEYKKGERYNVPESLYDVFKAVGACRDFVKEEAPKKMAEQSLNKMAAVPENKAADKEEAEEPQNKRRRR